MATKKLPQKKESEIADVPEVKLDDTLQIESVDESQVNDDIEEKKQRKIYYFGIFVSITIILLSILVVYTSRTIKKVSDPVAVAPAATDVPAETKKQPMLSIEVLNASGVSGVAKKNATLLEDGGYTVVNTGNETKETSGIELYVTKDLEEFSDNVVTKLKEVFPKIKYIETYESTNGANVKIIIGK